MKTSRSVVSRRSLRVLLNGAIDYAGLFPPSALDMATAVRNFRDYRTSHDAWALGRFVVPVASLDEFEEVAASCLPTSASSDPWRLSALAGPDSGADAARVAGFNTRYKGIAIIDSIEGRASTPQDIAGLGGSFDRRTKLFIELPFGADLDQLAGVISEIGARGKVRTGGITPESIPEPDDVARFIGACIRASIAFKATAGLHHAVRGEYPLTYEAGSAKATMFGFVNVLLAAGLAHIGASHAEVSEALQLADRSALVIDDDTLSWGPFALPADAIESARTAFALGFGSCSFVEPLDDLATLLGG